MKKIVKRLIAIIIGFIIINSLYFINTLDNNTVAVAKITRVTTTSTTKKTNTTTTTSTAKKVVKTTSTKKVTTTKVSSDTKVDGIGNKINGATTEWLNKLNNELNHVPKKLLSIFKNEGWTISVTGENLAQTHFGGKYSSVQGLTDYNEKYILIEDRDVAISESTVHEFGHFFDYYLDFISGSDEFMAIYNEEVDTFKSNITNSSCVRNEREFFAETFFYLYTNPSKCTPKAKAFISNLVENL